MMKAAAIATSYAGADTAEFGSHGLREWGLTHARTMAVITKATKEANDAHYRHKSKGALSHEMMTKYAKTWTMAYRLAVTGRH